MVLYTHQTGTLRVQGRGVDQEHLEENSRMGTAEGWKSRKEAQGLA
jgi:hypothetical protein